MSKAFGAEDAAVKKQRGVIRFLHAIPAIALVLCCGACEKKSAEPVSVVEPTALPAVPTESASAAAPPAKYEINGERIRNADAEPGNWMSHGRTYGEQRYSPLTRITDKNVTGLGLAWAINRAKPGASGIVYNASNPLSKSSHNHSGSSNPI